MVFIEKYKSYVDESGNIYKMLANGTLVERAKQIIKGYIRVSDGICGHRTLAHRIIWEAFNGDIPENMEIDHIDGNRSNNALENLRCVSHYDNMHNKVTVARLCKEHDKSCYSDFGKKFTEHFGLTRKENKELYTKEHNYYYNHGNKCSWEGN